jgi:hypothetical protein
MCANNSIKYSHKYRVFCGSTLTISAVSRLLQKLLDDLGVSPNTTPYSFKYVAMSYMVNRGLSLDKHSRSPKNIKWR